MGLPRLMYVLIVLSKCKCGTNEYDSNQRWQCRETKPPGHDDFSKDWKPPNLPGAIASEGTKNKSKSCKILL
jgi:hypothetical protein